MKEIEELKEKIAELEEQNAELKKQNDELSVNLLVYLTRLKFSIRGVLRRIKDFASHLNSFDITPKGIQDAILRVGEACKNAYIRNGLGYWYTCLLYPGMEPTDNLSEQVIREHVLMRKIIGAFRSQNGAEYYQYIASVFATWRLQGKDVYDELKELLYSPMNFV